MRSEPLALCLILASAGMVFSAGCSGWIRQSAVNAIAAEIQPPNPSLVSKLETSGNPTGQGVIVFVRSQSSCAPEYLVDLGVRKDWVRVG